MSSTKKYAVLTGDLVKSSRLSVDELAAAIAMIRQSVTVFSQNFPSSVIGSVDVFRGDGWQVLLENPKRALRLALFIRAELIASAITDSKVSIGVGNVDRIVKEKISESVGEAFEISGYGLDTLKKRRRIAYPSIGASVLLLDALVQQWSAKTAFAVAGALLGKTQEEIASSCQNSMTRQNISDALNRAGWDGIQTYLDEING